MGKLLKFWPKKSVTEPEDPSAKEDKSKPVSSNLTPEQEVMRFLEQDVKQEDLIELMLPGLFRERRERIAAIKTELAGIKEQLETLYRRREETLRLAQGASSPVPGSGKVAGGN